MVAFLGQSLAGVMFASAMLLEPFAKKALAGLPTLLVVAACAV